MWLSIQLVRDLSIWSIDWLLLDKMFNLLSGNELWGIMETWLLKMVYLLSASWALQSIVCLTIEKWSKLLRGAHPRESNFCLTIEFGLTIKICVTAAMSSLLHNGYIPKNVQWTWQFTTRPIRIIKDFRDFASEMSRGIAIDFALHFALEGKKKDFGVDLG